jgi:hypothetical protein
MAGWRQFAAGTFAVAVALFCGIHLVKKGEPISAAVDVALVAVMLATGSFWILTAEPIRSRRRTLHWTNVGGTYTLSVRPAARRRTSKRELRDRAARAAKEIADIASRTVPPGPPWWTAPGYESMTKREQELVMHEYASKSALYQESVMAEYYGNWGGEAEALFEEFLARGIAAEDFRGNLHPITGIGLERVARELSKWGKQL